MAFRVANLWLHGAIDAKVLPPIWFAGLHDIMSGHIWAQLPRTDLPPSFAMSERAFEFMYQTRRPLLQQLGLAGGGTFLLVLFASAVAYLWNNRRLPDPPVHRKAERRYLGVISDAIALRFVARRPLVQAGLFFTIRVLAHSVQNRLSIGIPLAVAIAVATVSPAAAGMTSASDFSSAPVAVLAVQLLFAIAVTIGFRHSIRVPADLRARWIFHLDEHPWGSYGGFTGRVPQPCETAAVFENARIGAKRRGNCANVPIGRWRHRLGEKRVIAGPVYTVLDRLEGKGPVRSTIVAGTPTRGGRSRRVFRLTAAGSRALTSLQQIRARLYDRARMHPVRSRS